MKKIIFFLSSWFLGCHPVLSQEIEWQNTIGGYGGDIIKSIQQTSDGGYIFGGWCDSGISGDKTQYCYGGDDYWIVKTDVSGIVQWQSTFGGSNSDYLESIQQTNDGGYILGGFSCSGISGNKTENTLGNYDYWIVKTDSAGNLQWQNTIGGSNADYLESIQQTSDGGYILAGYSSSKKSGDKTEKSRGGNDYWIIKTDSLGIILWQKAIGGGSNDRVLSIQQTNDGGYILGGHSTSNISGDKTENCKGHLDYWIVKTDALGNIQWQNTIGGSGFDWFSSIQQTSDGGYILGGYSDSNISGDKTENSNGWDYWIVKTDSLGNIEWQNTIGSGLLTSIQQTSDGGYILGGNSGSNISGDKTENSMGWNNDYWIVKTDAFGNIQWQNTIGGSEDDQLISIQQTGDVGYILGGGSISNISGDKSENSNGSYDYWIVKITDKYNSITGKLFVDNNSNGVQDAGELTIRNKRVSEVNTGRFAFTVQNGNYSVAVLDSGNYAVNPTLLSFFNYYNAVPLSHAAYFSGIHQTDSLNDFAFQPIAVINDLCLTITPIDNFRAGFNSSYMINYENVGTTTLNGTVIYFPDSNLTFVTSSPFATSIATDSIVWNVGTLLPFQIGSILVTVSVNVWTPIGTLVYPTVRIDPVAGDANPGCNVSAYEVYTTGSYDPNDIMVNYASLLTTQFPNPPYLEYIIRFQNTGNDTAFNVKILNPIDTSKLLLNTLEFVSSSHGANMKWLPWENNMEFKFDDIQLPDSNTNEQASYGFIRYRIKPKSTLVEGDTVKNNASIYFDFNAPVFTNTANTEIVVPTSINQIHAGNGQLNIFPNPAGEEIRINCSSIQGEKSAIKIFDLYGREVYQSEILHGKSSFTLNISALSKGIYILGLQSVGQVYRGRFVKQ